MRKTICKIAIVAVAGLLSHTSFATTYTCTMEGTQDRVIKVVYKEEGKTVPCEVAYTKEGETKSLWRYENTQGECEKRAEEFAEKQRAWGMTCSTGDAAAEAATTEATPAQ